MFVFFLMIRRPPRSTRTDTLFPYTTLFRSASAAADVVQDLYLKLRRIDARLPSDGEARRYLLKMAVNASIDHQRVEGRRAELLASAVDLFDVPQPGPEDAVLAADQLRSVDAALAELPEKCRQVLFMGDRKSTRLNSS